MTRFSDRLGYQPDDVEITVRLDAPDELRDIIVDIAYESGLTPHTLRSLVCKMLRKRADPSNWSAFPNVDNEVRMHLGSCEWYRVYDVVEALYEELVDSPGALHDGQSAEYFAKEINSYFRQAGIGWQLSAGKLETRGSEAFEHSLAEASGELAESVNGFRDPRLHGEMGSAKDFAVFMARTWYRALGLCSSARRWCEEMRQWRSWTQAHWLR